MPQRHEQRLGPQIGVGETGQKGVLVLQDHDAGVDAVVVLEGLADRVAVGLLDRIVGCASEMDRAQHEFRGADSEHPDESPLESAPRYAHAVFEEGEELVDLSFDRLGEHDQESRRARRKAVAVVGAEVEQARPSELCAVRTGPVVDVVDGGRLVDRVRVSVVGEPEAFTDACFGVEGESNRVAAKVSADLVDLPIEAGSEPIGCFSLVESAVKCPGAVAQQDPDAMGEVLPGSLELGVGEGDARLVMGFGQDEVAAVAALESAEMTTLSRLKLPAYDMEAMERDPGGQQAFEIGVDVVVHADGDEDPDARGFIGEFVDLGLHPVTGRDANALEQGRIHIGVVGGDCDELSLSGKKRERPEAERLVHVEDVGDAVVEARAQEPGFVACRDGGGPAGDVGTAGAKAKVVERAAEPVYEPVAGDALALGSDGPAVGEIANQHLDRVGKDYLESVGDERRSNGRWVVSHRGLSSNGSVSARSRASAARKS